jgi:hypothetical protein
MKVGVSTPISYPTLLGSVRRTGRLNPAVPSTRAVPPPLFIRGARVHHQIVMTGSRLLLPASNYAPFSIHETNSAVSSLIP